MPHYIDKTADIAAFREQFAAIRDSFVTRFADIVAAEHIERFLLCDEHGQLVDWIWSQEKFDYEGMVGTISDARSFLEHMIDEGMHVGCIVVDQIDAPEMWLATWEPPDNCPPWPPELKGRLEIIHDGVRSER